MQQAVSAYLVSTRPWFYSEDQKNPRTLQKLKGKVTSATVEMVTNNNEGQVISKCPVSLCGRTNK
jgi:hypothetical protein